MHISFRTVSRAVSAETVASRREAVKNYDRTTSKSIAIAFGVITLGVSGLIYYQWHEWLTEQKLQEIDDLFEKIKSAPVQTKPDGTISASIQVSDFKIYEILDNNTLYLGIRQLSTDDITYQSANSLTLNEIKLRANSSSQYSQLRAKFTELEKVCSQSTFHVRMELALLMYLADQLKECHSHNENTQVECEMEDFFKANPFLLDFLQNELREGKLDQLMAQFNAQTNVDINNELLSLKNIAFNLRNINSKDKAWLDLSAKFVHDFDRMYDQSLDSGPVENTENFQQQL